MDAEAQEEDLNRSQGEERWDRETGPPTRNDGKKDHFCGRMPKRVLKYHPELIRRKRNNW